jgi:hypothetical protein
MAYNVLTGSIFRVPSSSLEITGTFAGDGGGLDNLPINQVTNAANTRLITFANAAGSTLNGEANLTFNGSAVNVTGEITASIGIKASFFEGDGSRLTGISGGGGGGSADAQGPTGSLQFQTGSGGISGSAKVLYDFSANVLTINTGLVFNRTAVTANHTASSSEYLLGVDSSNSISILFDASSFSTGQALVVKDEGGQANTNPIVLTASGAQTIDGASFISIESPHASVNVYTDGSNWFIY